MMDLRPDKDLLISDSPFKSYSSTGTYTYDLALAPILFVFFVFYFLLFGFCFFFWTIAQVGAPRVGN